MKRVAVLFVLSGGLLLWTAGTAGAKGELTQADVEARGWVCFPGDVMVHCVHPNTIFEPLPPSLPSLNFSLSDGAFIGTENLIRADLGSDDRPCGQGTEEDGTYEPVDFTGDDVPEYFSCHHNNEL